MNNFIKIKNKLTIKYKVKNIPSSLISDVNINNRNSTVNSTTDYNDVDYFNVLQNGDVVYGVLTSNSHFNTARSAGNLFDGSYDSAWADAFYGDDRTVTNIIYKFTSGDHKITQITLKEYEQGLKLVGNVRIFYGTNGYADTFLEATKTNTSSTMENVRDGYDVKHTTIDISPIETRLIKIELTTATSTSQPGLAELELRGVEINGI
tara:strand:- start:171 stop:791 length:621 start_codon:yes stop_codon:yes gene_type:complete